jgi:hypothetical protein
MPPIDDVYSHPAVFFSYSYTIWAWELQVWQVCGLEQKEYTLFTDEFANSMKQSIEPMADLRTVHAMAN